MPDNTQGAAAQPQYPIVALCASAGGLSAFKAFFSNMPESSGMAFIVVQHLAPDQESILHDVIRRQTAIPVRRIEDEMPVEADHVYVLPAGYELQVWNGNLRLTDRERRYDGWPKTIDYFLHSLADDQGARAVAVILSGAGSDGLEGARAIKRNGGAVIAQDMKTSTQVGMARNVIDADLVDTVLPPDQMPDFLLNHFDVALPAPATTVGEDVSDVLSKADVDRVIRRLRRITNYDFHASPTMISMITNTARCDGKSPAV